MYAGIVFLLMTPALVQAQSHQSQQDKTKEEIMFVKNEKWQVTSAVLRLGSCQDSNAKKIE
jgi:hypothetical protein